MTRHKKGTSKSDNTGAYALAGVGSLLLLAAISAGSKKDADNDGESKKQVQTEPGTPSAQAITEAGRFIKKVKGPEATSITGDEIRKSYEGQPIPEVLEQVLNKYPGNTTFTDAQLAGNATASGAKGTAGAETTNTPAGDKQAAPPTVSPPHGDKNKAPTDTNWAEAWWRAISSRDGSK